MNLETFKARARRKLELPRNSVQPTPAPANKTETPSPDTLEPDTMTPPEAGSAGDTKSSDSSTDRFAAALNLAREREVDPESPSSNTAARASAEDLRVDRRASVADTTYSAGQTNPSPASEEELERLRSLLLGSNHKTQQDQVEVIYHRTQASVDGLRRDIDGRLDDLTEYVSQLEQSILNSVKERAETDEARSRATIVEGTELRLQQHNDRLDALDVRLSNTLTNLRAEFEADREADRAFLKTELAGANARTDQLLIGVTARLDASIKSIEDRLSTQLDSTSQGLMADSESTVSSLRSQLGNLIDERVKTFNEEQSAGLVELRDTLLANTKEINSSLKAQTEQQEKTLSAHRTELESQFKAAIDELTKSKVSHKDLSQLLARLADRIKLPLK